MKSACWPLVGALALAAGCASAPEGGPTVLMGHEEDTRRAPEPTDLDLSGPQAFPFRPPPKGGVSYRLAVEFSGSTETAIVGGQHPPRGVDATELLELEYRELPVAGRQDVFQLALDGLHYRLVQHDPRAEREVELWDDRIRTVADGEIVLDLKGAQPSEDLTPRKVLRRVFGTVRVDGWGNVLSMRPQGKPVARRFLKDLPMLRALSFARPALPPEPVSLGARWLVPRLPASPSGDLGLLVPVDYTLAGFQALDGVACAWLLLRGKLEGEQVPSAAGFAFDRVFARLEGEAWVELETSRIRLLRLEDEVRVAYTRGRPPGRVVEHRMRHRTQLRLELRDPAARPREWADGSERFGAR